jgi:hypothetical protein
VIAYGAGGSLETVRGGVDSPTGVYFQNQTVESVIEGILQFEAADAAGRFDSPEIQRWAAEFATPVFLRRLREFVLEKVPGAEAEMAPEAAMDVVQVAASQVNFP